MNRPYSVEAADATIGTGADGEPQVVMVTRDTLRDTPRTTVLTAGADGEHHVATVKESADVGISAPRARERAWGDNPFCIHCEQHIAQPTDSGLLVVNGTHRLAHKTPCFAQWVARHNPHFQKHAAKARAEAR